MVLAILFSTALILLALSGRLFGWDKVWSALGKAWAWASAVAWANVFLWMRDSFGVVFGTIWLLLHSKNLSDIFPVLPAGLDIAELINVMAFTKVMRWSFTLTIIGLIGNRVFDNREPEKKSFIKTPDPQPVPTDPNIPKGA
jgi:hypothetical protein